MQTNSVSQSRRLARLKPLAVALLSAGFVSHAVAAAGVPNLSCVAGTCNAITTDGTTTTMGQTSKIAVYETFDFSLARGNTLINRGTKGDVTLIRVTQNPDSFGFGSRSFVDGSVYSEPTFVLVNPWGISVSGQIVSPFGSIVLSGKDLDVSLTEDGYAGLMKDGAHLIFNTNTGGGYGDPTVTINSGATLQASADGGSIFLIGDRVSNAGLISAGAGGQIHLLAAGSTEVQVGDSGFISLLASSNGDGGGERSVDNEGTILTAGGTVSMVAHGPGSSVDHVGVVDVSNASGTGGTITLSAQNVTLKAAEGSDTGPQLRAEGSEGGGLIDINTKTLLAGDNFSSSITIDGSANLTANATTSGKGGTIQLQAVSDVPETQPDQPATPPSFGQLTVYGNLSAHGGASGGDGGTVQMVGQNVLTRYDGIGRVRIDVSAGGPGGAGGVWSLYSPQLTIGRDLVGPNTDISGTYVHQDEINAVLNGGASVSMSTAYQNQSSGFGNNLVIEADTQLVRSSGLGDNALFLQSSQDIVVGQGTTIASTSGKMNVRMLADADGDGVGSVRLEGLRSQIRNLVIQGSGRVRALAGEGDAPVTINTNGGDVTITGAQGSADTLSSSPVTDYAGVQMTGTVINTQGSDGTRGNVLIKGAGGGTDGEAMGNNGVYIDTSDIKGGFISIIGYSAGTNGVSLSDTVISTANQMITVNGWSTSGDFGTPTGVDIGSGVVINMGQGSAKILGLAEGDGATGVHIVDLLLTTAPPSAGGTPTFTLVGESRGSANPGIKVEPDAPGIRMRSQDGPAAASADVIIGAKADQSLATKALDLGLPNWNTIGRINIRPASVSLISNQFGVDEDFATSIRVGADAGSAGANFAVNPAWFVTPGATAENPDVTRVVIGSSGHTGQISVDANALSAAGPVTLQNQGEGSQGIVLGAQSMAKQTLNLVTSGPISQTGPLAVSVLNIIPGQQTIVQLNNAGNRIGKQNVGGGVGSVVSSQAQPSALNPTGITGYSSSVTELYFQQMDISATVPDIPRPFEGPDALSELRTDVYVKGQFGKPQICTPANTSGAATGGASSDIEPLSQEWTKVRRGAQLTNCSGVQADSNCSAF
ncbi:MAG: hypothetical protein HY836_14560 [Aquabacterium sp.]|uniref:beta strand repeat-containing protein n=1 Tax=Aquabacterium sp. TaxID=1872578 RepID=UPI0025C6A2AD|nr:hypothetical protein [Aquabacterium sp.]MBI5926809.1 hypothetical protein [Aquabacterium sp.]